MGGRPCQLKVILNTGTVLSEAASLHEAASDPDIEIPDDVGYKIVECLNEAEDCMFKAKRLFLESQGFTGPWPKSMREKGDKPHEY